MLTEGVTAFGGLMLGAAGTLCLGGAAVMFWLSLPRLTDYPDHQRVLDAFSSPPWPPISLDAATTGAFADTDPRCAAFLSCGAEGRPPAAPFSKRGRGRSSIRVLN